MSMAVQSQLYPENFGGLLPPLSSSSMYGFLEPVENDYVPLHYQNPLFLLQHQEKTQNLVSMATVPRSLDELQRQEIDHILQLQHERLRSALQEKTKQQLASLVHNLELKASSLMRQKEIDLAQANHKSMELQACLIKAQTDTQSWKTRALQNEATVMELNNTLEQAKERLMLVNNRVEDAESSISTSAVGESTSAAGESTSSMDSCCKGCKSRNLCVVFLPCRHLTSCKACEPILVSCPVCNSVKQASMEVFWV